MKFCKCFIYFLQFTTLCAWFGFRTISTRMLSYFFLFIKRWCWLNINLPWSISIKMWRAKLIPLKEISNMFSSKILILRSTLQISQNVYLGMYNHFCENVQIRTSIISWHCLWSRICLEAALMHKTIYVISLYFKNMQFQLLQISAQNFTMSIER